MFSEPRHARIVNQIYKRVPILWREDPEENPWGLSFLRMFDMANDAGLFHVTADDQMLPLYEAKMVRHFDHRYATYAQATQANLNKGTLPQSSQEQHNDPRYKITPEYWVDRTEVEARLARRSWTREWLLGLRDVARAVDERTITSSILPKTAVGHKLPLALPHMSAELLVANLNSFVLDYVVRQKMSGASVAFFIVKQLPVLRPSAYAAWTDFVCARVLELTYTAWDLVPFAHDLGDDGPPFRWDEDRRFLLRAELDAAFFHLYGIDRDDVDYIMETFPIVKRKDIAAHGTYRTKDKILEIYDAMTKAKSADADYQTPLTPPPGHGPRHPNR